MGDYDFVTLPGEILQQIAGNLDDCRDLTALSMTCKTVHSLVQANAVYREVYLTNYDKPLEPQNYDFKKNYIWRRMVLEQKLLDNNVDPEKQLIGQRGPELLEGVKNMLLEAVSKNIESLFRFTDRFPVHMAGPDHLPATNGDRCLLLALQLILTPLAVVEDFCWRYPWEKTCMVQARAYGYSRGRGTTGRLFGEDSSVESILLSLWCTAVYFLLNFQGKVQGMGCWGLRLSFLEIAAHKRGAWQLLTKRIGDGAVSEVAQYWFGSYMYMDRDQLQVLESGYVSEDIIQDNFDGALSTIKLTFGKSDPMVFTGSGKDIDEFSIKGVVRPLPRLHPHIPGWRRITFTKKCGGDQWLYDGCLVPGGTMIIGRWSEFPSPDDDGTPVLGDANILGTAGAPEMPETLDGTERPCCEGPFVMWSVDEEDWLIQRQQRMEVDDDNDFMSP